VWTAISPGLPGSAVLVVSEAHAALLIGSIGWIDLEGDIVGRLVVRIDVVSVGLVVHHGGNLFGCVGFWGFQITFAHRRSSIVPRSPYRA
jgi:hypothetical protein